MAVLSAPCSSRLSYESCTPTEALTRTAIGGVYSTSLAQVRSNRESGSLFRRKSLSPWLKSKKPEEEELSAARCPLGHRCRDMRGVSQDGHCRCRRAEHSESASGGTLGVSRGSTRDSLDSYEFKTPENVVVALISFYNAALRLSLV